MHLTASARVSTGASLVVSVLWSLGCGKAPSSPRAERGAVDGPVVINSTNTGSPLAEKAPPGSGKVPHLFPNLRRFLSSSHGTYVVFKSAGRTLVKSQDDPVAIERLVTDAVGEVSELAKLQSLIVADTINRDAAYGPYLERFGPEAILNKNPLEILAILEEGPEITVQMQRDMAWYNLRIDARNLAITQKLRSLLNDTYEIEKKVSNNPRPLSSLTLRIDPRTPGALRITNTSGYDLTDCVIIIRGERDQELVAAQIRAQPFHIAIFTDWFYHSENKDPQPAWNSILYWFSVKRRFVEAT